MRDRPKARAEGVVSEQVAGEVIVYDGRTQMAHCLSAEAAAVWKRCDGRSSLSELAHELALAPDVVERAVEALHDCGLLDEDPARSPGYSRREAAVKLAKAGGAAFAAPLIYSAAVGSAASAASTLIANGCTVTGCTASCSTPGSTAANARCQSGFCYCSTVPTQAFRCAQKASCTGDGAHCGNDKACCSGICGDGHDCAPPTTC